MFPLSYDYKGIPCLYVYIRKSSMTLVLAISEYRATPSDICNWFSTFIDMSHETEIPIYANLFDTS